MVAAEVANQLHADLDVLVTRKVGAPGHPELGIGAVAPDGIVVTAKGALDRFHLSQHDFEEMVEAEVVELERRLLAYRGGRPVIDVSQRTAVIVDDGLATGVTALAAVHWVRTQRPRQLILAVPVCTSEAKTLLAGEVDQIVCLSEPKHFTAVGQWYEDFTQTEDAEVLELLKEKIQ